MIILQRYLIFLSKANKKCFFNSFITIFFIRLAILLSWRIPCTRAAFAIRCPIRPFPCPVSGYRLLCGQLQVFVFPLLQRAFIARYRQIQCQSAATPKPVISKVHATCPLWWSHKVSISPEMQSDNLSGYPSVLFIYIKKGIKSYLFENKTKNRFCVFENNTYFCVYF